MTIPEKILKTGEDDWVPLIVVVGLVRQQMPDAQEGSVIESTLRIIGELVNAGLMTIGDLSGPKGGFKSWRLSPTEALHRIRGEWLALNRPISLGDVCWLANTDEGNAKAALLSSE